jgi:hypothetical protein
MTCGAHVHKREYLSFYSYNFLSHPILEEYICNALPPRDFRRRSFPCTGNLVRSDGSTLGFLHSILLLLLPLLPVKCYSKSSILGFLDYGHLP